MGEEVRRGRKGEASIQLRFQATEGQDTLRN